MFSRKLAPEDVFTPRSPDVNPEMYVQRVEQENALGRALKGTKNIIIFGESGSGKSWLYKKTLAQSKSVYLTANMANVSRLGSVTDVFKDRFQRMHNWAINGEDVSVKGGFNFGVAKLEVGVVEKAQKTSPEPFEQCLSAIHQLSGKAGSFIVIENIESVIDDDNHAKDIAGLITLVDDEDYAAFNTKLIIVGVPDDIQRYLSNTTYGATIANRIVEIPEVARLDQNDAHDLLKKGFTKLLKYKVEKDVKLLKLAWHADYIPQHIHEIGLEVAHLSAADEIVTNDRVDDGLINWLKSTLTADYTTIEAKMNARETKAGRRNQTIYTIAHTRKSDFKAADVEEELRVHFPASTNKVALNVAQMLSELATQPNPLIRRTPKGDAFRFVSPKLKVCTRAMLTKTEDEKIEKMLIR